MKKHIKWLFNEIDLWIGKGIITADQGAVVFCKDDASLPPGAYLGMARGLGDYKLVEVTGSHEALFTSPGTVVEGLIEAL